MIAQAVQPKGYEVALVLAPSNAAVANVAKRLTNDGHFGYRDVNVFGEGCDPCEFDLRSVLLSATSQYVLRLSHW